MSDVVRIEAGQFLAVVDFAAREIVVCGRSHVQRISFASVPGWLRLYRVLSESKTGAFYEGDVALFEALEARIATARGGGGVSGVSEAELRPMRRLWRAVLGEQLKLALGGADRLMSSHGRRFDRDRAVDWIGTRDFEMVCTFAGFDPDMVREICAARRADSAFDLRSYWRSDRAGCHRKAAA